MPVKAIFVRSFCKRLANIPHWATQMYSQRGIIMVKAAIQGFSPSVCDVRRSVATLSKTYHGSQHQPIIPVGVALHIYSNPQSGEHKKKSDGAEYTREHRRHHRSSNGVVVVWRRPCEYDFDRGMDTTGHIDELTDDLVYLYSKIRSVDDEWMHKSWRAPPINENTPGLPQEEPKRQGGHKCVVFLSSKRKYGVCGDV